VRLETARDDDALRVPAGALRFRPDAEMFEALGQEMPRRQGAGQEVQGRGTGVSGDAAPSARRDPRGDNPARPAAGTPGSRATIWQVVDGKLRPARVTVGLSDGTQVAIEGDALKPGTSVVTSIRESKDRAAQTSTASGSPLMPSMPRRGGRGL